ncbi:MAG: hypothetical protein IPO92_13260 [Saprospiraceae bacterium]|nr:hypothetical protein [Saprospiraceae bacterium]
MIYLIFYKNYGFILIYQPKGKQFSNLILISLPLKSKASPGKALSLLMSGNYADRSYDQQRPGKIEENHMWQEVQ